MITREEIKKLIGRKTFKKEGMGITVASGLLANKMPNLYAAGFFVGNKNKVATYIGHRLREEDCVQSIERFEKSSLERFVLKIPYENDGDFTIKGLLRDRSHEWNSGAVRFPEIRVVLQKDKDGRVYLTDISPNYPKSMLEEKSMETKEN